jgi:oxaloacetate decarboxylase alpha subunit
MEEVERVRNELGSPIMVTPFPQIVCTQAMLNVVDGERYRNVPDQVIKYVLGRFGRPTGPVDENVLDRILSLPRTRELKAQPDKMRLKEVRPRFPASMPDEEFLLRAVMPEEQVNAMLARQASVRPSVPHYNPDAAALLHLLEEIKERPVAAHFAVTKPGFKLTLRGNGHAIQA